MIQKYWCMSKISGLETNCDKTIQSGKFAYLHFLNSFRVVFPLTIFESFYKWLV